MCPSQEPPRSTATQTHVAIDTDTGSKQHHQLEEGMGPAQSVSINSDEKIGKKKDAAKKVER